MDKKFCSCHQKGLSDFSGLGYVAIWNLVRRLLGEGGYGNSEEVVGKWQGCLGDLWPGWLCWKGMLTAKSFTVSSRRNQHFSISKFPDMEALEIQINLSLII